MFNRLIIEKLKIWANKEERKPLVLRGARQVGKTTLVDIFAKEFDQYIYLNLELEQDRKIFENGDDIQEIIDAIFFYKKKSKNILKTLLFIDEIQNSPKAVKQLRYFYENAKDLFVIAAGSLLETLIDKNISFPVGRIEYLVVRPCNFVEFIHALNETHSEEILQKIPVPEYAHDKLWKLFRQYALIGGMPEVINNYAEKKDIYALNTIYDGLLTSYMDDVEKYARNQTLVHVIRHVIKNSFYEAGRRISFEGFGKSNYKSREIGETFRLLEKAFLLQLVYPVTETSLPVQPSIRKSPKLQLLDTGLVNYFAGLQKDFMGAENIIHVYGGKIAEHIVGQEILSFQNSLLFSLHFWTREKKQSNAEVDFIYTYKDIVIPIEVKSGATGRLRSLHEFMNRSPNNLAIRVYSGKLSVERAKTRSGKQYYLLNLPFYLVHKIDEYIEWFIAEFEKKYTSEK